MKCKICGYDITKDDKICPGCDTDIQTLIDDDNIIYNEDYEETLTIDKYKKEDDEDLVVDNSFVYEGGIPGLNKVEEKVEEVKPILEEELFVTKINRFFEKRKIKKLKDNKLFEKDKFYE